MPASVAVLLQAHAPSPRLGAQLAALKAESAGRYDVQLLYDNTRRDFDFAALGSGFTSADVALFDVGGLSRLFDLTGCSSRPSVVPGNFHLPALAFLRLRPRYDYVWQLEYDVKFTGPWRTLFDWFASSPADLLGTTLFRHPLRPSWYWWESLRCPGPPLAPAEKLRGFFPLMRLSRRAGEILTAAYAAGWRGHGEAVIPTALARAGATIEDLGGDGEFVRPGNQRRFYWNTPGASGLWPGTFVYRDKSVVPARLPPFDADFPYEAGKLYHPVKT